MSNDDSLESQLRAMMRDEGAGVLDSVAEVIEVAEGTPFIEMTDWDHEKLYALKGQIVGAGIQAVTGVKMPVNPKRRFQHGAGGKDAFDALFPVKETEYRQYFSDAFSTNKLAERIPAE